MPEFLLRRLFGLFATLLAASIVVFVVLSVLPGDPASLMLGTAAREDTLAALRAQMGLDRPLWLQYFSWIGGLVRGDFGVSFTYSVPVAELIGARAGVSVPLALMAMIFGILTLLVFNYQSRLTRAAAEQGKH